MTTDVLVITDGRPHIVDTVRSAQYNLHGAIGNWWIYSDADHADYVQRLERAFPFATVFRHPHGRQGFAGAVRYAWQIVTGHSGASHLFHLEDDFTFNRPVPVDDMARILDHVPYIAQLALRRQPWNDEEIAAGGVVETRPDEFADRAVTIEGVIEEWLEHRLFWTTNPSLIRREFIRENPWPTGERSEGVFSLQLLDADPGLRFAYYGARESGEWVRHIGDDRVGTGY